MSNLESAKAAIKAEIEHAKQGVAHFYARIEALEKTLLHLVGIDGGTAATKPTAKALKAGKPAKAPSVTETAKTKQTKYGKKTAGAKLAKGANELPFTGGDYWLDLISAHPQAGSEILHAAIANLGFKPTKEQVQKLTQRLTFALNAMVKAKKIKDSGSGRERRFFKE